MGRSSGLWDLCGIFRQEVLFGLPHAPGQGFAEGSLVSPRDILSEDENEKKQNTPSSDESFEPYPEKK